MTKETSKGSIYGFGESFKSRSPPLQRVFHERVRQRT